MKYPMNAFTDGLEIILRNREIKTVTVFVPPKNDCKNRIRITRKNKPRSNGKTEDELIVTYGHPNYSERQFLSLCKKAKRNPKRVWIKMWPKKRTAK